MFTSMNEIWELYGGEEDFLSNNLQYIFSIILIKFFFFVQLSFLLNVSCHAILD